MDEPQGAAAHAEPEQGLADGLGAVGEGEAVGLVGGEGHLLFILSDSCPVLTNRRCELFGRPFAALVCATCKWR